MRTYQLLTYHLVTARAMSDYGAIMAKHIESLRTYGIETLGIFTSPSRHNQVLALVSYAKGTDPTLSAKQYFTSPDFRVDSADFDWRQVIRREDIMLNPLYASI